MSEQLFVGRQAELRLLDELWHSAAAILARELNKNRPIGRNWQGVGVRLVNLEQVDQDLQRWANR